MGTLRRAAERAEERTRRRRRFPFRPLEAVVRAASVTELAELLGVDRAQVYAWRRIGVTDDQADTLACRLDLHPSLVWPGWADELEEVRRWRPVAL